MLERKCIVSIQEVEAILKKLVVENLKIQKNSEESEIAGERIYTFSDRYKTFFTKGYKCCACGIEGKYFALERHINEKRYHLNLYAINETGEEILMTKDHIVPKSLGGKNNIDNYQTMCTICNAKKGNGLPRQKANPNSNTTTRKISNKTFVNPKRHANHSYLMEIEGFFVRWDRDNKRVCFEKNPLCATKYTNRSIKDTLKEYVSQNLLTQEQSEKCQFLTKNEALELYNQSHVISSEPYMFGIDLCMGSIHDSVSIPYFFSVESIKK